MRSPSSPALNPTRLLLGAALVVGVALPALAGDEPGVETQAPPPTPAPQVHTVRVRGMVFEPATLEVSAGDTIEWVNEDLVPHTATALERGEVLFDSGVLAPRASWRHVAQQAGTFPYVCLLHPTMKATLIVR